MYDRKNPLFDKLQTRGYGSYVLFTGRGSFYRSPEQ